MAFLSCANSTPSRESVWSIFSKNTNTTADKYLVVDVVVINSVLTSDNSIILKPIESANSRKWKKLFRNSKCFVVVINLSLKISFVVLKKDFRELKNFSKRAIPQSLFQLVSLSTSRNPSAICLPFGCCSWQLLELRLELARCSVLQHLRA